MTYYERHRKDKSLRGSHSPSGSAKSPRLTDGVNDPSGMVHKTVDGLVWNKEIDFKTPVSKDKLTKGQKL